MQYENPFEAQNLEEPSKERNAFREDIEIKVTQDMKRCCQDCPIKDEPCCELAWAQMPYEAQEGDGK